MEKRRKRGKEEARQKKNRRIWKKVWRQVGGTRISGKIEEEFRSFVKEGVYCKMAINNIFILNLYNFLFAQTNYIVNLFYLI